MTVLTTMMVTVMTGTQTLHRITMRGMGVLGMQTRAQAQALVVKDATLLSTHSTMHTDWLAPLRLLHSKQVSCLMYCQLLHHRVIPLQLVQHLVVHLHLPQQHHGHHAEPDLCPWSGLVLLRLSRLPCLNPVLLYILHLFLQLVHLHLQEMCLHLRWMSLLFPAQTTEPHSWPSL
jgi:hypothetical protein